MNIKSEFPDTHKDCPARLFEALGAAREFIDRCLTHKVSYRVDIVKARQKYPRQVAVIYLGPDIPDGRTVHFVPMGDIREHVSSIHCWCRPQEVGEDYWEHNALDQRERYEEGELDYH